jgi:hypothetical protein
MPRINTVVKLRSNEDDCLLRFWRAYSSRKRLLFQRCLMPDDGSNRHIWNVGKFLLNYGTRYNIPEDSSYLPPWDPENLPRQQMLRNKWRVTMGLHAKVANNYGPSVTSVLILLYLMIAISHYSALQQKQLGLFFLAMQLYKSMTCVHVVHTRNRFVL